MTNTARTIEGAGRMIAERIGLQVLGVEGHDLKVACPACDSSDACRIHQDSGVAHCFSCGGNWSAFQLCETVLKDRKAAIGVMVDVGLFAPSTHTHNGNGHADPVETIARQKRIPVAELRRFGAKASPDRQSIELPAYGPDGQQCTSFVLRTDGTKGKFASNRPAGIFLPNDGDQVRLPRPGETWAVVEGPKDAAALSGLDFLAVGLNTSHMHAKFARLFRGVNVLIVPDRDRAGEDGAAKTAAVLYGVAASVRTATLPIAYRDSHGADVRDVLATKDGETMLRRALDDAAEWTPPARSDAETSAPPAARVPSILSEEGRTELANSRRFTARFKGRVLYCELWAKFLTWMETHWAIDVVGRVPEMAKEIPAMIWQETAEFAKELPATKLGKLTAFFKQSASARGVEAMLKFARVEEAIRAEPGQFDRDLWSLNVANGTIDLRTGTLRTHRREDFFTKLAPVVYDPAAKCPAWEKLIRTVTGEDEGLATFLQRAAGYSLTGDTSERALFFLHGAGRNGKTTFVSK